MPARRPPIGTFSSLLKSAWLLALICVAAPVAAQQNVAQAPTNLPFPPAFEAPQGTQKSYLERAITGAWYGETGPAKSPSQRFKTIRNADGTYFLEVRTYAPGSPTLTLNNSGIWGISNGIFFTIITQVNGRPVSSREPIYTTAYVIRSINANEFRYQHLYSGMELRVVRVFPDMKLPD